MGEQWNWVGVYATYLLFLQTAHFRAVRLAQNYSFLLHGLYYPFVRKAGIHESTSCRIMPATQMNMRKYSVKL